MSTYLIADRSDRIEAVLGLSDGSMTFSDDPDEIAIAAAIVTGGFPVIKVSPSFDANGTPEPSRLTVSGDDLPAWVIVNHRWATFGELLADGMLGTVVGSLRTYRRIVALDPTALDPPALESGETAFAAMQQHCDGTGALAEPEGSEWHGFDEDDPTVAGDEDQICPGCPACVPWFAKALLHPADDMDPAEAAARAERARWRALGRATAKRQPDAASRFDRHVWKTVEDTIRIMHDMEPRHAFHAAAKVREGHYRRMLVDFEIAQASIEQWAEIDEADVREQAGLKCRLNPTYQALMRRAMPHLRSANPISRVSRLRAHGPNAEVIDPWF